VSKIPISVTIASINGILVLDPTEEEEAVMDARITLDTEDGGNLCAGQKGEPGYLTPEQILTAAEWSIARGKEIRQRIKEATGA
jgi:exosome complex component RRP42